MTFTPLVPLFLSALMGISSSKCSINTRVLNELGLCVLTESYPSISLHLTHMWFSDLSHNWSFPKSTVWKEVSQYHSHYLEGHPALYADFSLKSQGLPCRDCKLAESRPQTSDTLCFFENISFWMVETSATNPTSSILCHPLPPFNLLDGKLHTFQLSLANSA